MDKYFRIVTLAAITNPQQLCWKAMHQDYSSFPVADQSCPPENESGQYLVEHCLKFGHYGVVEHASITFNCIGFPHDTLVQLRTHRVGISFDVMSQRYCSEHILAVANYEKDIEEIFYLRPVGTYTNRQGKRCDYTNSDRQDDLALIRTLCDRYASRLTEDDMAEEQARGMLSQNIRQHFVMTVNARSLMHLLDLRYPKNAQLECQWFCDLLFQRFAEWMPEVAEFYRTSRLGKSKLAP
jgi:thymidylate synthase (FAD)